MPARLCDLDGQPGRCATRREQRDGSAWEVDVEEAVDEPGGTDSVEVHAEPHEQVESLPAECLRLWEPNERELRPNAFN